MSNSATRQGKRAAAEANLHNGQAHDEPNPFDTSAAREAQRKAAAEFAAVERCRNYRYAITDLPPKIARKAKYGNQSRDRRYPPKLSVTGDWAATHGATAAELEAMRPLTDDEIAELDRQARAAHTEELQRAVAKNHADGNGQRALHITWASEIEPKPVPWLWVDISASNASTEGPDPFTVGDIACVVPGRRWSPPDVETNGRIACGMVTIAAGREGSGKSSFGIWLTSKITRGTLPGSHYGVPRRVYYLATEDSWKHTLVPRLMAAGADLTMVARIEVAVSECATVTLSLPDDTALLAQAVIDHDVALVVIDPLMSTLGASLDANGSRDVRTALEPLAAMADKTGAAVVGIAHFNKATGADALSRITGSGAFKDVARAVMVFATAGDERVFTQPKNSVGRSDLPSLNYEIQQAVVPTATGKTTAGMFAFTGIADRSVDDMLADERNRGRRKSPVVAFLVDYLAVHADPQTGEVDAADVIAAGEAEGHSRKQIIDARNRSKNPEITTRYEGRVGARRTFWSAQR